MLLLGNEHWLQIINKALDFAITLNTGYTVTTNNYIWSDIVGLSDQSFSLSAFTQMNHLYNFYSYTNYYASHTLILQWWIIVEINHIFIFFRTLSSFSALKNQVKGDKSALFIWPLCTKHANQSKVEGQHELFHNYLTFQLLGKSLLLVYLHV